MSEIPNIPSKKMTVDEAIRRIRLKLEVRKENPWSAGEVCWVEIGEVETLIEGLQDWQKSMPLMYQNLFEERERLTAAEAALRAGLDESQAERARLTRERDREREMRLSAERAISETRREDERLRAALDEIQERAWRLSVVTCDSACSEWTHPLCWVAHTAKRALSGEHSEHETKADVEAQLADDRRIFGTAYYRLVDGRKVRIPPRELYIDMNTDSGGRQESPMSKHAGACTCPACAPDLWAAGIKGSAPKA